MIETATREFSRRPVRRNSVAGVALTLIFICGASPLHAAGPRPAEVPDTLEQRLTVCAACHGKALTGMEPAIPGLVGLSPDYIDQQMGAWKVRRRVAAEPDCMARVAALLTPQDIAAVAAWLGARSGSTKAPPTLSAAAKLPLQCGSVMRQPDTAPVQRVDRQPQQVTHGEYLARAGDCSACHSARNMLGAVGKGDVVAGGLIPIQNWYAPSLTSNRETGLGDWETSEVVDLLKTGVSARGVVFGPMSTVVRDTLQHPTVSDITAMATYVKSQTQEEEPPEPTQIKVTDKQAEALVAQGAKLYDHHCADCHQRRGEGVPRIYPPLENNESIVMR